MYISFLEESELMTDIEKNDGEELIVVDEQVKNKNTLTWSQLIYFFVLFFGISIILGAYIGVVLSFIGFEDTELVEFTTSYFYLILDAIVFFAVLIGYKKMRKFTVKALDFSVLRKGKTYLYVVLSLLIVFCFQLLIIGLLGFEDGSETNNMLGLNSEKESIFEYIFLILSIAIITPIKEEFLFRGIIHRFFDTKYNFWLGLIISSVIFGALHIGYPVTAIIMGIIFVVSYKLTNSLVTPILIHMLWNLYAVIIMLTV